jgi:putative SOS response-associated peptidase YedK
LIRATKPFQKQTKDPLALAGIFDVWRDEHSDERLVTYAIITTKPNEIAARVHNRMPAILEVDQYETWLDPHIPLDAAQDLLLPPPDSLLETYPVDKRVNMPQHDEASLIQAATWP